MNILKIVTASLFILCFPLLLLSSNLRFEVGSTRLYEYGFDKYHAVEVTGIEKGELKKAARGLIDYFNDSRESPQIRVTKDEEEIDLFTQREIDHLKDVKDLIRLFYSIQWITLGYVVSCVAVGFVIWKRAFLLRLTRLLFLGGVFTFGLLAFFGIWAAIDFDNLFHTFHVTSFSNDLWQLDPSVHHLIMMFPEDFFLDAALFLIGGTLAEALILGGGAWVYRKRKLSKTIEETAAKPGFAAVPGGRFASFQRLRKIMRLDSSRAPRRE